MLKFRASGQRKCGDTVRILSDLNLDEVCRRDVSSRRKIYPFLFSLEICLSLGNCFFFYMRGIIRTLRRETSSFRSKHVTFCNRNFCIR